MATLFMPYCDGTPALLDINGHKLLVLATEDTDLDLLSDASGADEYRRIEIDDSSTEVREYALAQIAGDVEGGVVIAPAGVSPGMLISELGEQLPWVH